MTNRCLFCFLLLILCACNDDATFKKAEDAQDAGRQFIRASLDGNYDKAKFYLFTVKVASGNEVDLISR